MEKIKKQKNIKELKAGDIISDLFVVKFKKPVQEYARGYRFEVRIGDSSGEIMLKYWGDNDKEFVQKIYDSIEKDGIVFVKGTIGEFNNNLELSVNDPEGVRMCKSEEYDPSDFILTTEKDIEEMYKEIEETINNIQDPILKKILNSFFSNTDFVKEFKTSPAAMYKHHGWIGGLLEHTLNVVNIFKNILKIHKEIDKDLLLTGAILHDIGKIREFEVISSIRTSKIGMLKGHIILGLEELTHKLKELSIKEEEAIKLIHILISHHGKLEFGSPKVPSFPEALAVYYADEMDAKLTQMINTKKDAITEDDYIYTKDFGNVYLK